MKNYIIRNIDPDLWRAFKARCASEGISIRQWIIIQVTNYVTGHRGDNGQ